MKKVKYRSHLFVMNPSMNWIISIFIQHHLWIIKYLINIKRMSKKTQIINQYNQVLFIWTLINQSMIKKSFLMMIIILKIQYQKFKNSVLCNIKLLILHEKQNRIKWKSKKFLKLIEILWYLVKNNYQVQVSKVLR